MKKIILPLLILLGMVISTSCTHRLTDFTVISTKNIPITSSMPNMKKADMRVKGVDTAPRILFIPIGSPNMKEAIDKAIEQYPGCVGLTDGVVKSNWWWALLYGQDSYIVEGTPIYVDETASSNTVSSNVNIIDSQQLSQSDVLFYHEVKQGEKISDIAKLYDVKVADIIKWNKMSNSNLKTGEKIKIYLQY